MTEKILERLNSSGHNLHLRVFQELIDSRIFKIEELSISPYYVDPIKKIPREIDIIAKTFLPNGIKLRFFIECTYLLEKEKGGGDCREVAFFERKLDEVEFNNLLYQSCNYNRLSISEAAFNKEMLSIRLGSKSHRFHVGGKVGIFCEPFKQVFDSVDTCLKACTISNSGPHDKIIDYLILVVDGSMYKVEKDNFTTEYLDEDLDPTEYQLLLVNYIEPSREDLPGSKKMLVEITNENYLGKLIEQIYNEAEKLSEVKD